MSDSPIFLGLSPMGVQPIRVDWSPISSLPESPERCGSPERSRTSFRTPEGISLDVSPHDRSFLSSVSLEEIDRASVSPSHEREPGPPASGRSTPQEDHLPAAEGASWRCFDAARERVVGSGSYAEVAKVYQPGAQRWFALKRSRPGSARARRHLRRELQALQRPELASHPGVARLVSSWEESGRVVLQLELCHGTAGDLARRLGPMREEQVLAFLWQVLSALSALHTHGLAHLDLKPENVLFKLHAPPGEPNAYHERDDPFADVDGWSDMLQSGHFKLSDFALLTSCKESALLWDWGSSTVAAGCFVPVELVRESGRDRASVQKSASPDLDPRACDVYGAGACGVFMATVKAPVRDDRTDEVLLDHLEVGGALLELFKDLLSPLPGARGTAADGVARVELLSDDTFLVTSPSFSSPASPTVSPPRLLSPSASPLSDATEGAPSTPKRMRTHSYFYGSNA